MSGLDLHRVRSSLILFSWACSIGAGCAPFDDTQRAVQRGSLGEEIYKIVCERMATSVWPTDVQGNESRALCRGEEPPSAAPEGTRLRALAENRDRLVAALDRSLPAELEDELQTMLIEILPFYEPPLELLPKNTRAVAALLTDLMEDEEAMRALGLVSQRRGMHPQRNALGLSRPILSYPGLPDLASSLLSAVDDGGALEAEWSDVLEAGALAMATSEPSAPDDATLASTRDLLFRTHESFGSTSPRYVVARDSRGLPIPAFVDGSQGFVDLDSDGLADTDELGRFLAADGSLLSPPTPFAVVGETGATRDAAGRAMTGSDEPLYVYHDVEQTLLAGLLREASPLFDPANPVLVDLIHGLLPMLGADGVREEAQGETSLEYDGFQTETGALFDLVHAIGEVLTLEETRDLLAVAQVLLTNHENDLVPLIESGLFGDALGDQHPEVDLAARSELWDDVLRVATWMSEAPGLLEALLRAFSHPDARRLGAIFAEMALYKDVPQLDPNDENVPLTDVYWSVPVDRTQPDAPGNMSLLQQTVSGIHELNGAPLCNKAGARAVVDLDDVLGFGGTADLTGLLGGPWGRCELIRIDNSAHVFAQAVIGRAELVVDMPIVTFLNSLKSIPILGDLIGSTLDGALELLSGIDGFTTTPTPQALARLIYGTPNAFVSNLVDPPTGIDGVPLAQRYDGKMVLAWERGFRFCGDRILAENETCSTTVETIDFYRAATPVLLALDDYDPLVDEDGDPATPPRLLFAELVSAFATHYPTSSNPAYQYTDPSGPNYVRPDRAVTYEPLVASMLADCEWQPSTTASGRTCALENSGRLISRFSRVAALLDSIEVAVGVDGIDVLASALGRLLSPALNPGLANRAGAATTTTNDGSRTLPYSPAYLVLDALNRMDVAHAADPERNERWLSARSRLVDMFIETEPLGNDRYRLENRRLYATFPILLDFFVDQIDRHADEGDLSPWARAFDDDLAESLGGALGARTLRLLDAIHDHPETEQALLGLLRYLADEGSPNDAFDNLLMSSAEWLFLLEDDDSLVTLMHALADGMAVGATSAVAEGGAVDVEAAIVDQFLGLLAKTNEVDTAHTFFAVLRNAFTHPSGDAETPIEVIADVIGEVNRATPNKGGPLAPDDYGAVLFEVEDMLTDEDRGLERLYAIMRSRELE